MEVGNLRIHSFHSSSNVLPVAVSNSFQIMLDEIIFLVWIDYPSGNENLNGRQKCKRDKMVIGV